MFGIRKMITTNVDKAIQLLEEKGKIDVKDIAKTLKAKQDSIDLILSYLEEDGIVELKYGVFHTIASLKKKKPEKKPKIYKIRKKEELAEEKPEPKPPVVEPKPVIEKPKPSAEGIIPEFDETKGTKTEKRSARLANMMIKLLEKQYRLPKEKETEAEFVFNDLLHLAKTSKIYKQKDKKSAEFTLCSLLFTIELLKEKYAEKKEIDRARKLYSTYNLMRKSALEIDKTRLKYYKKQINSIHKMIIMDVYPELKKLKPSEELKPAEEPKPELEKPKPEITAKPLPAAKPKLKPAKLEPLPEEPKPEIKPETKLEITAKPLPAAKPIPEPKPMPSIVLRIPKLDVFKAEKEDKSNTKLVNTMITLLEKFYTLSEDKKPSAVLILNDVLKIAKENKLYSQKNTMSAEFILCSLLIGIDSLLREYDESKDMAAAKKINSTYHLMREVAIEVDRERLKYYKEIMRTVYQRAMESTFLKSG